MQEHLDFLARSIDVATRQAQIPGGGPFGALVVQHGQVLVEAGNEVTLSLDPTAHAEVVAIRQACQKLGQFQLPDCVIYCSCEPCPMCLGAIFWARPQAVYFAATRHQAAAAGFDDAFIYEQIAQTPTERSLPFQQLSLAQAEQPFQTWRENLNRKEY